MRTRRPLLFLRHLAAALLVVLAAPATRAQTLQLVDGQVLLAQVDDANDGGIRVSRLDNGGALDLRWDQLSAECALRVKQAFGLAGENQDEILVQASEVRYAQNGTPQTLIGRIVDQPAVDTMVLQQKGVQYKIPRTEIMQIRQLEVPVSQIYTPDEFYSLRLTEIAPGDQADKHVQLAEELVRVRDYAHGLEHLSRAKELANSRAPERIDALLERVKLYVAAKKERDLLDQIQIARTRATARDFENGSKLVAQFEKDYPQSRLKSEFEAEKKRFADARTRFLSQQVADTWRRSVQVVADKKLQEPGLEFAAAREFAQSKMGDEIAAMVAQRLKLELEEVRQLWSVRDKYPNARRTEHYSYGTGSWVLGEAAILKGTQQGKAQKEPEDPAAARELEKLAKAIQKLREQQRAQRAQGGAGPGGPAHEETEDEWWQATDRMDRLGWLKAFYAEHGGHLVVTSAYTQPCFSCGGLGQTSEFGPNNKVVKVKCTLCHGTKWLRSFKAY